MINRINKELRDKNYRVLHALINAAEDMQSLRLLLAEVNIAVVQCVVGSNTEIQFINESAKRLINIGDMEPSSFGDLIAVQDRRTVQKAVDKLNIGKEQVEFSCSIHRIRGDVISLHCLGMYFQNEKLGSFTIYSIIDTIVEKQVKSEDADLTNYAVASLICKYESGFTIVSVSDRFCELTGYTAAELIGSRYTNLVCDGCAEDLFVHVDQQCQENGGYRVEYRFRINDGRKIWILGQGKLADIDGQKVVKAVVTDITEKKEMEEQLRIVEKRYEISLKFSDVAVFDYDLNSKIMNVHQKDCFIFGIPAVIPDAVNYLINSGVVQPKSKDDFINMYEQIYNGVEESSARIWINGQDGRERVLEMRLAAVFDRYGNPIRAVGMHKDITDIVSMQKEQQYSSSIVADMSLAYEVNLTEDKIENEISCWLKSMGCIRKHSFSDLIDQIEYNMVSEEHKDRFKCTFNKNALIEAYDAGQKVVSMEFVQVSSNNWYKKSIHMIYDEVSDEYLGRCYITDITPDKQLEHRALLNKRYYESILAKSAIVYEVNLTKNLTVAGYEELPYELNEDVGNDYNKMIALFGKKLVHPKDQTDFFNIFSAQKLLTEFYNGNQEHSCDYRLRDNHGNWRWFCCTAYIFEDPLNKDICGFSYVEKIDNEKKRELELLYKSQYDALSGFYNKQTIKEKIDEYLGSPDGRNGQHVFFIVDIDYFKTINDSFGHAFGDAVISEFATKLKSLFRDFDILGRIGGDEFAIFMKNFRNIKVVQSKAQKICEVVQESYSKNGVKLSISASVGVAYYKDHGSNYYELYTKSDAALYKAKELGRNRFVVYDREQIPVSNITKIDEVQTMTQARRFEDNVCGYVFRILYDSYDYATAINAVLGLLGRHYNVSRVYIFEDSEDGLYTSNTFEWCSQNIEPQITNLKDIPHSELTDYRDSFNEEGIFYLKDLSMVTPSVKQLLEKQNIKKMLQIAWTKNDVFKGFIGFDDCDGNMELNPEQLWDYRNIANLLGVFIMEMRNRQKQEILHNTTLALVNSLDSYAYVCDPNTHKVLFINKKAQDLVRTSKIGDYCYKAFWNLDSPCSVCPMGALIDSNTERYVAEMYNTNLKIWVKVSTTWVEWMGETKACLVNSVDITEYKQ